MTRATGGLRHWFRRLAGVLLLAGAVAPLWAQTTFTNSSTILLPAPPGTGSVSNAVPGEPAGLYPSAILVSGMGTQISKLVVRINDFRHTAPDDVDMLLVGPQGQKMIIWSDVGGFNSTCGPAFDFMICNNTTALGSTGPTVTLDDTAAEVLGNSGFITSGAFQPVNVGTATDMFPAPAPAGPYNSPGPAGAATFAGVFNGTDPNGLWRLYVIDDALSATGRINGGWSLIITTSGSSLAPTTTTITADTPDPSTIGAPVQVAYSVSAASGTPTGAVTVTDGIDRCTGTVASGSCAIVLSTPGTRTLTATYAGDAAYQGSTSAGVAHVVNAKVTTTTIVSHAPVPSDIGQGVTVAYTVTSTGGTPTGTVTVSDGVNACTGTVAAAQCVLAFDTPGSRVLAVTYVGQDGYAGSAASVAHAVRYNTTTVISGHAPNPSGPGQAVTVSFVVAPSAAGGPAPGGNVTVSDGTVSCTATVAAGSCALTLATTGVHTLSATYAGDAANKGSVSSGLAHTVNANATTTTIVSHNPAPSDIGQIVVVAWTVTGAGGTPTGTVTVSDGVNACTGTVAAAQCTVAFNTPGGRPLSVTYPGDANFAGSAAAAAHTVRYNTTTVISAHAPNPSGPGQAVTVSFAVAPTAAGGPAPGGLVTVSDGSASCAATVAAGSCALTLATTGPHTLGATYAGDGFNKGSTAAGVAQQVNANATTTTIVSHNPAPSDIGQNVAVAWTVTGAGGTPTGTVTASDGVNFCTASVATGQCALALTTPGARPLAVTYPGDANFTGSAAAATHTVRYNTTTVISGHTPNPSVPGQAVTVSYTVTPSAAGGPAPTGTVTVSDGVNFCAASVAAGSCPLTLTTTGAHTLVATYAGDGANKGSTAAGVTHQVNANATTTTIVSHSPAPSDIGQNVTVVYTVTGAGGTPTGTVTVSDGVNFCAASVAAGRCTIAFATPGNRPLAATYPGDASYNGSAASTTHTVRYNTTTVISGQAPNPSSPGQPVTVTFTVTPSASGGPAPTGTVTVSDGTVSCTGTVAAGACALTLITAGAHTLVASYPGDAANSGGVSAGSVQQVSANATTTAIVAHSPSPSDIGQGVTVAFTVTAAGGTPAGTVTVSDGVNFCAATVAAGQCVVAFDTPGNRVLAATYVGQGGFTSSAASATHTVRYNTATVISAHTPNPSAPGQPVTVSFTVVPSAPGGPAPTGNVTVSDGTALCTGTVAIGSCALTLTTAGTHTLTATYAGDTANKGSVATGVTQQVSATATTTTIVSHDPAPSDRGAGVTVVYTVTGAGGTPAGTVTVSDGVNSCAASVAAGQCVVALGTPGNRVLAVTYAGQGGFSGSAASTAHTVRYDTITTITGHSPNPSTPGQLTLITWTVLPTTSGGPAPTGAVTVGDGVNFCTGTAAGGSCSVILGTPGTRTLSANYAGDGFNRTSLSAGAAHTVASPDLTIRKTHTGSFSPGQVGALYTITVTNSGGAPSAGTVTVTDVLPSGLTGTAIGGTGWTCTQPAGPCTRADALAPAASFPPLTLTVTVAVNAPATVINVALVAGGGDADTSNNTATDPTATGGAAAITLTASKWGSGTGTLASNDGGIACGPTCTHAYAAGTSVTLNAVPDPGSLFTGWLGACTGTGSCVIVLAADSVVSATFAQDGIGPQTLDVDANGHYDALTDGIVVIRYLFGLTGTALTNGVIGLNANRADPAQILTYLDDIEPRLDIDGNGQADALTDGLLALRYLFGLRGASLVQGVVGIGATRNSTQIETYLQSLLP